MSTQNASVGIAPAYAILSQLLGVWGYYVYGSAFFDCTTTPVTMNVISTTWDGTKLTIAGTFNTPCTGRFTGFEFDIWDKSHSFGGFGRVEDINIGVTASKTYTVYLIESLSAPTTAPVQSA